MIVEGTVRGEARESPTKTAAAGDSTCRPASAGQIAATVRVEAGVSPTTAAALEINICLPAFAEQVASSVRRSDVEAFPTIVDETV
ncbi:MAG: hypothetical protein JSU00_01015 [Acidobacteria bacterium]|nr:hypothetical protein [Acidobacteriota bacterium]